MSRPCKKDSVWIMENRVQLNTVTAGASGRGKTRRSNHHDFKTIVFNNGYEKKEEEIRRIF